MTMPREQESHPSGRAFRPVFSAAWITSGPVILERGDHPRALRHGKAKYEVGQRESRPFGVGEEGGRRREKEKTCQLQRLAQT